MSAPSLRATTRGAAAAPPLATAGERSKVGAAWRTSRIVAGLVVASGLLAGGSNRAPGGEPRRTSPEARIADRERGHVARTVTDPAGGPPGRAGEVYRAYRRMGAALFGQRTPPMSLLDRSCEGCHDTRLPLAGVVLRYPRHDRETGRFVTLEEQILRCLADRQGALVEQIGRHERVALEVHLKELDRP